MNNSSITTPHTQGDFLKFDIYLNDIIRNYNAIQGEIHQAIKDIPEYQIFYKIVTKWVFCETDEKYYNIDEKQLTSKTTFMGKIDPYFTTFVDALDKDIRKKYKQILKLERFIRFMYLITSVNGFIFDSPSKEPVIFQSNKTLLNTYNHTLITKERESSTIAEEEAIEMVKSHIKSLTGEDMILDHLNQPTGKCNYEFFMDWISYQVQFPSKLLHFAPVIQGLPGIGKSFLVSFLKALITPEYVKAVANEELRNPFNHYSSNRIVNVVEELYIQGRQDNYVLQKMKDFITNDEFVVNRKNLPQYSNPNKTNYLFLTNHKNCLPLEETERRYWIIYSPITFNEINTVYTNEYFNKLFATLEHKEVLRHYFLHRKISKEFLSYNRAPKTTATNELLELTKTNVFGYEEAVDLLEEPSRNYNENIIISNEFFTMLKNRGVKLYNRAKKDLMKALGYKAYKHTFRYATHKNSRVFIKEALYKDDLYKDNMDSLAVRAIYENTLINDLNLKLEEELKKKDSQQEKNS